MFARALKLWRSPRSPADRRSSRHSDEAPLRGALFSSDQMVALGRQLALTHRIATTHARDRLLARLAANERVLHHTWQLIADAVAAGQPVTPAAEWLLDNQYLIAEEIRIARRHLPPGYSRELPRLAAAGAGQAGGSVPRVYDLALQAISHCDGRLSRGTLSRFVAAYQSEQPLDLGELWAIPIMLRLALIENLRRVSVRIGSDRADQEAAARWAMQMTDAAAVRPSDLVIEIADMARSGPALSSAFVAEFTRRLQGQGAALALALTWTEQHLAESGQTIEQLVRLESQHQATAQVSVANSIGSLRLLAGTDWREFVETLSHVEHLLRADPADAYGRMDFASRDAYRHVVERTARRAGRPETAVAQQVLDMAEQAALRVGGDKGRDRLSHVGYYLLGAGRGALEDSLGIRHRAWWRGSAGPMSFHLYLGMALLIAVMLSVGPLTQGVEALRPPMAAIFGFTLLMFFGTLHLALALLNWLATLLVSPQALPRMDFSHGIPSESRTLVVVPTLLGSAEAVESMVDALELRYLANRDANLQFALLTDFHDAAAEHLATDVPLVELAGRRINELNDKYRLARPQPLDDNDVDPFLLLHRPRRWNAREGVWMGHERKRGKLADLNALLRHQGDADAAAGFSLIVGDTRALAGVRYVITLDADTQLPRDSAAQMVAAMAHPLNRPRFGEGPTSDLVVEGHGILQPRVSLYLPSTALSGYARLFGGEPGIDPYTRTVSDIYQDLFGEGSFIGKGIYDVDAFERALRGRFPENRILSHDLIEGCHARSGLLSDVELFEDAPLRFGVDVSRRHRWIRGDWQLLGWLRARLHMLPGAPPNPLPPLARWKLLDNLRRSLTPIALLWLLLLAWLLLPEPGMWTLRVLAIIGLVPLAAQALEWLRTPLYRWRATPSAARIPPIGRQLLQLLHGLACLPYEAWVNADAVLRTLWRLNFSRRHLLEWTASADVAVPEAQNETQRLQATARSLWLNPSLALGMAAALAFARPQALPGAAPVLLLWLVSPLLVWWIDRPLRPEQEALSAQQQRFLRQQARRTWAFFESFVTAEENHLPPDNVQEQPVARIAHRTSPSNMGFALLANLAAYEMRWLTLGELLHRTQATLTTLEGLERYRGHFFNWYDTHSLQPLRPRYLSSVDSGNLAAAFVTLRAALSNLADEPPWPADWWQGLQDTQDVLCDTCTEPPAAHEAQQARDMDAKLEQPELLRDWLDALEQSALQVLQATPSGQQSSWLPALRRQAAAWRDELALIGDGHESAGFSLRECALAGNAAARVRMQEIEAVCERLERLIQMDLGLLYDGSRHLLYIGYNLDERRADEGHYDLLASEARLAVLVAIALGQLPQRSWFALGRLLGTVDGESVLMSWSGSMFEYLMPLLLAPQYPNTLLEQTCRGAVARQIAYGKERGVPWGMSESGYNATDAALNYQYRAFGVPGLGLKRGLGEDLVIAPYASMLALMVDPVQACENLQRLAKVGASGNFGMHEAVDYTRSRLPSGQTHAVVRSFMAHHQGMALLAMTHALRGPRLQQHFASDPRIRASLLLLQERVPKESPPKASDTESTGWRMPVAEPGASVRAYSDPYTPWPELQLLSNGSYHVMVTQAGGGYSRWKDLAVTRWSEDPTCDAMGSFCYVRDVDSGEFWATALQPTLHAASRMQAVLSEGKAEFRSEHEGIHTHLEVAVSPEDQVELRRLRIRNSSRSSRRIELTSYAEVVLAPAAADAQHPAFSKLFVHTEILDDAAALLCQRRPRGPGDESPWLVHLVAPHLPQGVSLVGRVSYESDRARFIGRRGSLSAPAAMREVAPLSGSAGAVLDPVAAGRCVLRIEPDRTAVVDFVTGVGNDRGACLALIEKYRDRQLAERVFELAWTHSQVLLRQLNAEEREARLFARMAGAILYHQPWLRADPTLIAQNRRSQSGLWGYAISGDLPIVLLQIAEAANLDLVRQLVVAHAWWRMKGLAVDLVIWNEERDTYRQRLQEQILGLIAAGIEAHVVDRPGGIFVRHADQIPQEDRLLLMSVARIVLSDRHGSLSEQLDRSPIAERRAAARGVARTGAERRGIAFVPRRTPRVEAEPETVTAQTELQHFNGYGGFNDDATEYVIDAAAGRPTPAPWVNVIANPRFGTVVSESGAAYTWFENAHEFRLTPWHNDPVTDPGGELIYLRDEDSGRFWCATPQSAHATQPSRCRVRHGFGYSVFEQRSDGLRSILTVYVALDRNLKFMRLQLHNESGRPRRVSATAYVEWVLGDTRARTAPHIVTERSADSGALLARNAFGSDFAEWVAFLDIDETHQTTAGFTCDRAEFIGRHRSAAEPAAMGRAGLSGRHGATLDPCAAWQLPLDLAERQTVEIVFRLGAASRREEAEQLIQQGRGEVAAAHTLDEVKRHWQRTLGAVQIRTPDPALDALANGWLLYQTLACRLWARSGFYQSGGAFGFRDQLQDTMALVHTRPELLRAQLLLCASRQFVEGDVQHWWHPPTGRGVRTHISDDLLWLPLALCRYVRSTGDSAVLSETVDFIEGRALEAAAESYFDLPSPSARSATLYEHALLAIRRALRFGPHGLPLMGGGDWNDGMNLVGHAGQGESIWLGFFLCDLLRQMASLARSTGDEATAHSLLASGAELAQRLEAEAWDGQWYRRAYFDDGSPLGSAGSPECRIDSIAQSWAVLSGVASDGRASQAMESVLAHLWQPTDRLVRLLDPPFDGHGPNPGYISGYLPGVRENGGQYTHAAIWAAMAYAKRRDASRAWMLLDAINPLNHARKLSEAQLYRTEPYVMSADVYAHPPHAGRGGWSWYTGSAGWMYQLILESVLGLTLEHRDGQAWLLLRPCLPPHWRECEVRYRFRDTPYRITLARNDAMAADLLSVDGVAQPVNDIALQDDRRPHEAVMSLATTERLEPSSHPAER